MLFKLLKQVNIVKSKETKEEMKFTSFFLELENGTRIKILPNIYTDDKEVKHSNFSVLNVLAEDVSKCVERPQTRDNDLPF